MEKKIQYRIIKKIDRKIYKFLLSSSGTKRIYDSFKKNKIIFALAHQNKNLIGCIPLEPRTLLINKKKFYVLFITNAFVKKNYQNIKIGTNLLNCVKKNINKPIFAFRAFKNDQASKWYKKNGFYSFYKIICYEKKINKRNKDFNQMFRKIPKSMLKKSYFINKISSNRVSLFYSSNKFINRIYHNNYYKNFFNNLEGYVYKKAKNFFFIILTQTSMGDKKLRIEIIDHNFSKKILHLFLIKFYKNHPNKINKMRIKVIENKSNKDFYNLNNLKKIDYFSNLLCNETMFKKIKKNQFNSIEYL